MVIYRSYAQHATLSKKNIENSGLGYVILYTMVYLYSKQYLFGSKIQSSLHNRLFSNGLISDEGSKQCLQMNTDITLALAIDNRPEIYDFLQINCH